MKIKEVLKDWVVNFRAKEIIKEETKPVEKEVPKEIKPIEKEIKPVTKNNNEKLKINKFIKDKTERRNKNKLAKKSRKLNRKRKQ